MRLRVLGTLVLGILLNGCLPLYRALNFAPSQKVLDISFSDEAPNPNYTFFYSDTLNHLYLRELRQGYGIDTLISSFESELDKIKAVLKWASSQWEHNGYNSPSNPDALTILKESKNGNQFRCVEYGILASACLNSVGIPARVLGLKTRDVEKVRRGAGHVVAETYSRQFDKWIFIDPQFNVLPMFDGVPLNAIEFQEAIVNNRDKVELVNMSGKVSTVKTESYLNWIGKYLFYFDVLFDQRIGNEPNYKSVNGKTKLMLVPLGEKDPAVFQRSSKINYCFYTHSAQDFYKKPEI